MLATFSHSNPSCGRKLVEISKNRMILANLLRYLKNSAVTSTSCNMTKFIQFDSFGFFGTVVLRGHCLDT